MKLDSIVLENFGLYGHKVLRLENQPLVLLYGPNEAGKTTALNGIRQALFGFPRQNAYITGKTMSAQVVATLSDQRTVRFTRTKKNTDGFNAVLDNKIPLSESQWNEVLGGLDLKAYVSLFGFSLEELRSGEKALAHAPLEQALSGSGFGGLARLQHVQQRIESSLADALKRVGTKGSINAKLLEIQEEEKQLENVLTLPSDIERLRSRRAELQAMIDSLGAQLAKSREELGRCERLRAALPRAAEYRQVLQSLASQSISEQIDEQFRYHWTIAFNRYAAFKQGAQDQARKLDSVTVAIAELPERKSLLDHAESIRALHTISLSVAPLKRQLIDDTREIQEIELELSDSLRKIHLQRGDDSWRELNWDLHTRAEIDDATEQLLKQIALVDKCKARHEWATSQLQSRSLSSKSSVSIPNNLALLESLINSATEKQETLRNKELQFKNWQSALEKQQPLVQLKRLTAQFDPDSANLTWDTDWNTPGASTIATHQKVLWSSTARVSELESKAKQLHEQIADWNKQIREEHESGGLISMESLEELWKKRDQQLGVWIEELKTPLFHQEMQPKDELLRIEELRSINQQADNAVRQLLAAADRVARINTIQAQVSNALSSVESVTKDLADAKCQLTEALAAWKSVWSNCPFNPGSPDVMAQWLELYVNWSAQQKRSKEFESETQGALESFKQACQQLREQWPVTLESNLNLATLRQELRVWQSHSQSETTNKQLQEQAKLTCDKSVVDLQQAESDLVTLRARFEKTIASSKLPAQWPAELVAQNLESLKRCQSLASKLDKLRDRLQTSNKQHAQFQQLVHEKLKELNEQSTVSDEVRQVGIWMNDLQSAEQMEKRRNELNQSLLQLQTDLKKSQQSVIEEEQKLLQLVQSAGAKDIQQVQSWITMLTSVLQLRARKAELSAAIESYAGDVSLDDFLNQLECSNATLVAAETSRWTAKVGDLEAQQKNALQEIGAISQQMEARQNSRATMESEQRLKQLRRELVDLSEQWVVYKLAGELLTSTIDRFVRDHEPELIKHTRKFFSELTEQRYAVVEHDSGKHGGFAVRDQLGNAWQPDKLSTGTREQLYLAIRLAFITYYNEHHEPLPVIMDDCFVNFDDVRARTALRCLTQWPESPQTILFSCHWRTVEALAELAPEAPVIMITSGETAPARHVAERALEKVAGTADRQFA